MAIATWNIPWINSKVCAAEFKTDVDGEYTAHEQRNKLWSTPRRSWSLWVQKTKPNYLLLLDFFMARGGRFGAFLWKWDSSIDNFGDDVTYKVRFDIDKIEFDVDGNFWVIPIVQVVTDE